MGFYWLVCLGRRCDDKSTPEQTNVHTDPAEEKQPSPPSDDGDMSMEDWGSELHKSNDEAPKSLYRRHKKPKIDDWAQDIMQDLVERKGQDIKMELQSETPDFSKIEKAIEKANQKIQKANGENNGSVENNIFDAKQYRRTYGLWCDYINLDHVKGNPEYGWRSYDGLHSAIFMIDKQYGLPNNWNIPPDVTLQRFVSQLWAKDHDLHMQQTP